MGPSLALRVSVTGRQTAVKCDSGALFGHARRLRSEGRARGRRASGRSCPRRRDQGRDRGGASRRPQDSRGGVPRRRENGPGPDQSRRAGGAGERSGRCGGRNRRGHVSLADRRRRAGIADVSRGPDICFGRGARLRAGPDPVRLPNRRARIESRGFSLGIRPRGGGKWTYVDGEQFEDENVQQLFPDFPMDQPLPDTHKRRL